MHNSTNKLIRWKAIIDVYNFYKTEDIPTTVIYRKYIYPRFYISLRTLNNILSTPVYKLLKEKGIDTTKKPLYQEPLLKPVSTNFYLQQ